ncbi:ommochrome-binding protein-like [Danaus plexippus]|uniref:ommochrome-binding protein-like n=1 Tax=Danaus plexippus TaxID=13037 RepID=UPI002AB11B9D|nr:ommochrome-binding protein-like [Danaus plexippus]
MSIKANSPNVTIGGKSYKKSIILADVNIPYKFSIDRKNNILFFCINADEFSDQSFQSVELNLYSGCAKIVPSIRNGFASAVDQTDGTVYLGGSDGVYKYDYQTHDVRKPAIIKVEEYGVHHCAVDGNDNLIVANPSGLFCLPKGSKSPERIGNHVGNIRGITTDAKGEPYLIAQDGIYSIDCINNQIKNIFSLDNGYGLAFDKNNMIVYGDERCVAKLIPWDGND